MPSSRAYSLSTRLRPGGRVDLFTSILAESDSHTPGYHHHHRRRRRHSHSQRPVSTSRAPREQEQLLVRNQVPTSNSMGSDTSSVASHCSPRYELFRCRLRQAVLSSCQLCQLDGWVGRSEVRNRMILDARVPHPTCLPRRDGTTSSGRSGCLGCSNVYARFGLSHWQCKYRLRSKARRRGLHRGFNLG
jgi:hypothetical protein